MRYKNGDKVKIKSFDWYYSNSDCMGDIQCGDWYFTLSQASYCGKVLTISAICDDFYMMKGIGHHWTDEMIECLVDESQEKMVSLDKACEVVSEMVQKFCPNLIRCGEDLKYWEDEFRKKLEE